MADLQVAKRVAVAGREARAVGRTVVDRCFGLLRTCCILIFREGLGERQCVTGRTARGGEQSAVCATGQPMLVQARSVR